MKIQDIAFFIFFLILIFFKNPRLAVACGIFSLILAMPLFHFWIFFTAERLTWYAGAFFLLSIVLHMLKLKDKKK